VEMNVLFLPNVMTNDLPSYQPSTGSLSV